MAAQISPPTWAHCQAMASRVEQGAQGLSPGHASPLAAATPMRTPVKDPGPAATATTSIPSRVRPVFFSRSAAMGIRVAEWVSPLFWKDWASSRSSSVTATEAVTAEVSSAMIFINPPPRWR